MRVFLFGLFARHTNLMDPEIEFIQLVLHTFTLVRHGSHPFARTLPDTWFLVGSLSDILDHRRESGTDAISLHHDEGTELGDF